MEKIFFAISFPQEEPTNESTLPPPEAITTLNSSFY